MFDQSETGQWTPAIMCPEVGGLPAGVSQDITEQCWTGSAPSPGQDYAAATQLGNCCTIVPYVTRQ